MGRYTVDPRVVAMVAERDGVDATQAERRVIETLRLATDAQAQGQAHAELAPERRAHLVRSALARRWADDVFEPSHRPSDIPKATIEAFHSDARFVHPRIHRLCQVVAVPSGDLTEEQRAERLGDPSWRDKARARMDTLARRLSPYLEHDPSIVCPWIPRLLRFEDRDRDGIALKFESGGFDLDACARKDASGSCTQPRWDPSWIAALREATEPRFVGPFETSFGVHWVYLDAILPAQSASDPATDAAIRAAIHPEWRRDAFAHAIANLRADAAVKVAGMDAP